MAQLLLFAALFFACGLGILGKQASGSSCPIHSREVGRWAIVTAVVAFLLGIGITTLAVLWGPSS